MNRELKNRQQVVKGLAGVWGWPVAGVISRVVGLYEEACSDEVVNNETLEAKLEVGAMSVGRRAQQHPLAQTSSDRVYMKLLLRQRYT